MVSAVVNEPNSRVISLTARLDGIVAGLYGFLVVALVAGSAGGYFSTTWGWTALVTLWLAAVALLVRGRTELSALDLAYAGGLLAFGGWVALSNFWTPSVPSTMHEVQRNLAYIGVVAAGLLVVRAVTVAHLLGGVLAAIVVLDLYGLATRLLPDRLGTFDSVSYNYRLAPPITYWNGLAIFSVMGILLALGFATRGRHLVTRVLAAATLPILFATMYFTFSRAAWYALGAGLLVAIAVDPRRLQLIAVALALAPWPAVAIAAGKSRDGLTTRGASLEQATTDGHSLVPVLAALAAGAALTALAAALIERRVRVPALARYAFATLVVAIVAVSFTWIWVTQGSPATLAERGWNAFRTPPTEHRNPNPDDVSARLLTLSANGRLKLWRVSLDRFEEAPLLGQGAGTYWQAWVKYRDVNANTIESHSLYFGTLGELGIVGLALLVVALVAPIVGAFRARGRELVPLALGAYIAWVAHTGVDWDWALVGVSAVGLLCAVALLRSSPAAGRHVAAMPTWATAAGVAVLVFLSVAAIPQLLADHALRTGRDALPSRPAEALERAAEARTWAPWSSEPDELAGDAYRSADDPAAARDAYAKALRKHSSSWILWTKLADVTTGREHLEALRRAHALNPYVEVP